MLGSGFAPGQVTLHASRSLFQDQFPNQLNVNPDVVTANASGNFFTGLSICGGFFFGKPYWKGVLVGTDSNGVQSNPALF